MNASAGRPSWVVPSMRMQGPVPRGGWEGETRLHTAGVQVIRGSSGCCESFLAVQYTAL